MVSWTNGLACSSKYAHPTVPVHLCFAFSHHSHHESELLQSLQEQSLDGGSSSLPLHGTCSCSR